MQFASHIRNKYIGLYIIGRIQYGEKRPIIIRTKYISFYFLHIILHFYNVNITNKEYFKFRELSGCSLAVLGVDGSSLLTVSQ